MKGRTFSCPREIRPLDLINNVLGTVAGSVLAARYAMHGMDSWTCCLISPESHEGRFDHYWTVAVNSLVRKGREGWEYFHWIGCALAE
jgi:hypothetical protein